MPELPEVEAITAVAARHSIGRTIKKVEVVRQPKNGAYFGEGVPSVGTTIKDVRRVGKHVMMRILQPLMSFHQFIDCHNAMTGYWDWEHEPWTFDYVEGRRSPLINDVRVRITLDSGLVMRFYDLRFFGRLRIVRELPTVGPELMTTPMVHPSRPIITLQQFADWIHGESLTIKEALMDQSMLAGIGNIYANEACTMACIDPHTPGKDVRIDQIPVLLEALRAVVSYSIPKVNYEVLRVYRRNLCGFCSSPVVRTEISKRATFTCRGCQSQ